MGRLIPAGTGPAAYELAALADAEKVKLVDSLDASSADPGPIGRGWRATAVGWRRSADMRP